MKPLTPNDLAMILILSWLKAGMARNRSLSATPGSPIMENFAILKYVFDMLSKRHPGWSFTQRGGLMDSDKIRQMIREAVNGDRSALSVYQEFTRALARGKIAAPKVAAVTLLELEHELDNIARPGSPSLPGSEDVPEKSIDVRLGDSLDVRIESSNSESEGA